MEGWIKLYRKFCEWEWFNISEMVHLFIYLLLNANHEDGKWRGVNIKRGQIITGRNSLSENTGISSQSIRTCLNRLKSTNEITITSTNKYSIITITKYEDYQIKNLNSNQQTNQQDNQQLTNNQPTTNQQLTTNKNNKNKKNNKKIKEVPVSAKPTDFIDQVIDLFVKAHGNYEIVSIGKERSAAGKIVAIYKKKYPESTTEQVFSGLEQYFKRCVNINDNWLKSNMSLPIIVDKFNVINNILKNGTNKGSGTTDEELADLLYQKING